MIDMSMEIPGEPDPPFALIQSSNMAAPILFNSPHSGRNYPEYFVAQSSLTPKTLRKSEDFLVDILFEDISKYDLWLLKAHFPRAFLDVNREPYELDPKMFHQALPDFVNSKSVRVAGGLGTVPRIVAESVEIYSGKIDLDDALNRISNFYIPYHRVLKQTLDIIKQYFGMVVLIDCHSMPSSVLRYERSKADIILGDRFGGSCSSELSRTAQELLEKAGYRVHRNQPYAGGYITQEYGDPDNNQHAIQIEINRGLYMNEKKMIKSENFECLKSDLTQFSLDLADSVSRMLPMKDAAE